MENIDTGPSLLKVPRPVNKIVNIDDEEYVLLPEVVNEATSALMLSWNRLGKPTTVFSEQGKKLMEVVIATWMDLFPRESRDWMSERAKYKSVEKSLKEQVKSHSGRSLASIPLYIHKLMKLFFTEDVNLDRKYYIKLVKIFPAFQFCNKV